MMRTGDIVRHYPSGEAWVVARVKDGRVYWMGWPAGGSADMSECKLVWTCRDEQHLECLQELAGDRYAHASLRDYARRKLEEMGQLRMLEVANGEQHDD